MLPVFELAHSRLRWAMLQHVATGRAITCSCSSLWQLDLSMIRGAPFRASGMTNCRAYLMAHWAGYIPPLSTHSPLPSHIIIFCWTSLEIKHATSDCFAQQQRVSNPQHNSLMLRSPPRPCSFHPRIQLAMGRIVFLPQLRQVLFSFFFFARFSSCFLRNRCAYIISRATRPTWLYACQLNSVSQAW